MKRLAFFVEGYTETLFVEKLIEEIAGKNKVIIDGRNIYEPDEMKELGYTYYSIGRPTII